jgi:S1-C subfamily serine protease
VNYVDLLVIAGMVIVALIGWRAGLIATALGFAGFLFGVLVGALGIPALLAGRDIPAALKAFLVLAGMVVAGVVGQALFGMVGRAMREAITFEPVRFLDSLGGLAVSATAFVFAAWLLLSVAATVPVDSTSEQVRNSRSYTYLERFMAGPTDGLLVQVRGLLDTLDLPRIPFNDALLPQVGDSSAGAVTKVARKVAHNSVTQVSTTSRACGRSSSGSAVVVGPGLAVTNAHVIAGADAVFTQLPGARQLRATVVYRDPGLDVAVLRVPGLAAPAPRWVPRADRGDPAVVAGYPLGGPLRTRPATLRGQASIPNDRGSGSRDVYVFRGRVQPGNSGGALLDPKGQVIGLVFASAKGDQETGFALTAPDVSDAVRASRDLTAPVKTGACSAQ